jgi:hypothetical protein
LQEEGLAARGDRVDDLRPPEEPSVLGVEGNDPADDIEGQHAPVRHDRRAHEVRGILGARVPQVLPALGVERHDLRGLVPAPERRHEGSARIEGDGAGDRRAQILRPAHVARRQLDGGDSPAHVSDVRAGLIYGHRRLHDVFERDPRCPHGLPGREIDGVHVRVELLIVFCLRARVRGSRRRRRRDAGRCRRRGATVAEPFREHDDRTVRPRTDGRLGGRPEVAIGAEDL